MGISGLWVQRAAHDYTGATKWGNGYDPVHEIRDAGRGRVIGTRENLYPLGDPSGPVSDTITARDLDFVPEDYYIDVPPGEAFRYQDDRPDWGEVTPQFRDASNSPAMGEQPPWGVYHDDDPSDIWPRPGPTGGTDYGLAITHGEATERQHAIAVPTRFVTGGWLSKERGALARPEAQDPAQEGFVPTINTGAVQGQGLKESANERAVARGTDAPRSAIRSRTAGMAAKDYAKSFGMGGGSGTPDMAPFQLTAGLKRPWFTRTASLPRAEDHFMNTMEQRTPFQRATAPDPYQGDPEVGAGDGADTGWGY